MPLKLIVEALDEVPEAFRGEYEADGEKFKLKVEGGEDVTGLKSALDKERKDRKELAKKIKAWEALGKTAEEISEMLTAADDDAATKNNNKGDTDALLKQHQGKWEKERADLLKRAEVAESSERRAVVSTQLLSALGKLGATEEGLDLLPERLSGRIKYTIEDDERVIQIVQADGKTPLAGASKDGTATFEDLAKEAMAKWPSLFKASGTSGSGTRPNQGAGGSGGQLKRSAMGAKEKSEYIEKHGQTAYLKLPK